MTIKTWDEEEYVTIVKHSFDIQSICSTRFKVSAALEFGGQQTGASIFNEPWVDFTDQVLSGNEYQRYFTHAGAVLCHLRMIRVDRVKTHLVLKAERQNDGVHPVWKLAIQQSTHTRV